MAPMKDRQAHIALRRLMVARLFARGIHTAREIAEALPKGNKPVINPDNGKPYHFTCIAYDLRALRKQWALEAQESIAEGKARQLAEVQELKRTAYEAHELNVVAKCLEREAKLMGYDAPFKVEDVSEHDIDATIERELAQLAIARQAKAIEPPTPEIGVAG